ncbi:uncharacterized protein (DUF2252 family) [Silvibacterium bohemicum]|uniref:Uncharacterized protein (DUF2252 family) n=1 Tax=Silvibacterium bohemicum TaxID=1577686 RepID=A0A841JQL8_9BACT|nr:DUF2252 family protein [Silvibacterium bohemicum]MBB6143682.1 uncharacterized protein (DUF2252 family) [Silvibacterium bohemicum]
MANAVVSIKPRDRARVLIANRQLKMAQSAHAYVRGNTLHFYEWLKKHSSRSIPEGPSIWICGDCHVGNIGPLADSEGKIEIQIRDLDQTVVGNPAHDLVRLALSLATAARGSDLPGVTVVKMMEQMIEGYESALAAPRTEVKANGDDLTPIQVVLEQSRRRRWHHLAEERIEDVKPQIPLGKRFWTLDKKERDGIEKLFQEEAVTAKILEFKGREKGTTIAVVDSAYWMKGCSSLGRLRYAVLLGIGKKNDRSYCLIDLKEAASAAAPQRRMRVHNNAQRVVTGARELSPNLGERMLAVKLGGKDLVMRELMPQDLKFDLDRLTQEQAVAAARYLAGVVGKAHGRQMDSKTRSSWLSTLKKQHSKSLDAPSWLWSSVVALIADHETAYLEHCRLYASGL